MKRNLMLMGVLFFIAISPQLAVCGETNYPIKDSKFPAAEAKLGWIDNERVMFHGYDVGKMTQPGPGEGHPTAAEGLFIWDIAKGTVTKYWDVDESVPLCVYRGSVFFSKKLKEKENIWLVVSGPLGKEEQKEVSGGVSVNGHSCRVSAQRPGWMKEDKHRRLRLLEEHGYLDFGIPSRADPSKASLVMFYQFGKERAIQLPFTGEQIRLHVAYFEFDDSYILEGQMQTTYAAPIWKLKPDGTTTKILQPLGEPWEELGWGQYNLTKKGLFLAGGSGLHDQVGTTGGYLLSGDKPVRLIAGLTRNIAVSPDGCKVVFVHMSHSLAGAESFKALRQGKPGTRTVKMIQLCAGTGE
ncbi:hypothetical protein YTPLAS72_26540 [Nitrospira sp.]|nr:hypothetical protein YTPLAS72_26540 [Nitrospira sp.]